jgi:phage-related protein
MPTVGKSVEEIRVSDESGAYRVIYYARRSEAIYVLTLSRRRRKRRQSAISTSPGKDSHNC